MEQPTAPANGEGKTTVQEPGAALRLPSFARPNDLYNVEQPTAPTGVGASSTAQERARALPAPQLAVPADLYNMEQAIAATNGGTRYMVQETTAGGELPAAPLARLYNAEQPMAPANGEVPAAFEASPEVSKGASILPPPTQRRRSRAVKSLKIQTPPHEYLRKPSATDDTAAGTTMTSAMFPPERAVLASRRGSVAFVPASWMGMQRRGSIAFPVGALKDIGPLAGRRASFVIPVREDDLRTRSRRASFVWPVLGAEQPLGEGSVTAGETEMVPLLPFQSTASGARQAATEAKDDRPAVRLSFFTWDIQSRSMSEDTRQSICTILKVTIGLVCAASILLLFAVSTLRSFRRWKPTTGIATFDDISTEMAVSPDTVGKNEDSVATEYYDDINDTLTTTGLTTE